MEIAQQKLAWALAMAALLILVYKLDLHRTVISKSAIVKVKAGLILNLAGAIAGVLLRIGLASGFIANSVITVLIETLGGYVLGWTLVIWGLVQGLGSFFDSNGNLKLDLAVGKLSHKLASSLLNGGSPCRIMEDLAGDLLGVLRADAITLHRIDETGRLRLSYSVGLNPATRNMIRMPESSGNIYQTCMTSDRPVIADNPLEITLGKRLELSNGPARSAMCLPAAFSGKVHGLITVYRKTARVFRDDDCQLLRIAGDGLGLALWRQYRDDAERTETRYGEVISLARRCFIGEKSPAAAMIKTAKLIHGHTPFEKMQLDVLSNGKSQLLDFDLSTGGVVSIRSGYFSKEEHPAFYSNVEHGTEFKRISENAFYNALENTYHFPVEDGNTRIAQLTIRPASAAGGSKCLSMLGTALCPEIAAFLRREKLAVSSDRTHQRLGAIRFLLERAESGDILPQFLENAASAIVDLMPATVCRTFLIDSDQRLLESATLAQCRDLEWPNPDTTDLRLDSVDFTQEAFVRGVAVEFGSHLEDSEKSAQGHPRILPSGIRRGICLPLTTAERAAGLIVIGDARRTSRSETRLEDEIFVSAVAELISMFLIVHRGKLAQRPWTGRKGKLTLRKREMQSESAAKGPSLTDRSRINGPLAGILASCEYLKSRPRDDSSEVARFIDIIQRNAARIHSLTSKTNRI